MMLEVSIGGPNGTIGARLEYDFLDRHGTQFGLSVGAGYSAFSKSLNSSLMFNTRFFRRGNADHESGLQLSLGTSYRGQSERLEETQWAQLWGEDMLYTADYTLFLSSSVGYSLAYKSGWRFHVYAGWELPVLVENYTRHKKHWDSSNWVEVDESKMGGKKGMNNFWPNIGLSLGRAF